MTNHQPTPKNTTTSGDYPQTKLQLLRSVTVVAGSTFLIGGIAAFANGLLPGRAETGWTGALMLIIALISGSTYFLSGPMARRETEVAPVPVSELGLTPQDFVLLQLACIEHANRLIADADTEDDDFGPDGDLALQFRAEATRLLAMHHEFTERSDGSELTAPCHGNL